MIQLRKDTRKFVEEDGSHRAMIGEPAKWEVFVRVKSDHGLRNEHALDDGWELDTLNPSRLVKHIYVARIAVEVYIVELTPDFASEIPVYENQMRTGFSLAFAALDRNRSIHGLGEQDLISIPGAGGINPAMPFPF